MQSSTAKRVITGPIPQLPHEELLLSVGPAAHCNTAVAHLTHFRLFC